ncbi:alpha/beta hydrolase [Myxococcota bacterium]|nr:alpha/beta hydrolase [Myxococcota bacterium]
MPIVSARNAEIYYESHGEGRNVVFAHGAGGNAASWWNQVPFFAERGYRTIAFDHRGFGRSACASDDFDPAEFPGDLSAILDAENVDRTALVCQSMGGWTGLPMALSSPERVSALVLCGTPGGLWTDVVAASFAGIAERVAQGGAVLGPGGVAVGETFRKTNAAGAFLYEQIANFNRGLDPSAVGKIGGTRIAPAAVTDYRTPTLVISGNEDVLFPPEALVSVAEALPGARLERFDGAGHSTYFEQPDRFNQVVIEFLEAHP